MNEVSYMSSHAATPSFTGSCSSLAPLINRGEDWVYLQTRSRVFLLWVAKWRVSWSGLANVFTQPGSVHVYGFTPVCVRSLVLYQYHCSGDKYDTHMF